MYSSLIFLHVVGATLLGFYLLLPFLTGRVSALSGEAQKSYVGLLTTFNKAGQFSLIAAFLTGGALISQVEGLSVSWMITSVVLFLALGASSGILGANLKRISGAAGSGSPGKVNTLSWISAIVFIAILFVMENRW